MSTRSRQQAAAQQQPASNGATSTLRTANGNGAVAADAAAAAAGPSSSDPASAAACPSSTTSAAPPPTAPLSVVVTDAVKRWYQDAEREAARGDVKQQALLAQMLTEGYGCHADLEAAKAWADRTAIEWGDGGGGVFARRAQAAESRGGGACLDPELAGGDRSGR